MVPYFKIMYLVRRNSYSLASASERCHRERRRAIRGADGDVRPLPLGRGSTWRPADRCGQADQCAYVRPSEGRGVGRGGRRVRERAWVVTQLGGRWGGLGRCAPPRRGDADPRRNTMPTSSAAHVRHMCRRWRTAGMVFFFSPPQENGGSRTPVSLDCGPAERP